VLAGLSSAVMSSRFILLFLIVFFPVLPYFRIPTGVKDGENLYQHLIFINDEMNHKGEFLYDHAAHVSVTYGIVRRMALQRIDLDYYLFLET
jgi:hypothetical protein